MSFRSNLEHRRYQHVRATPVAAVENICLVTDLHHPRLPSNHPTPTATATGDGEVNGGINAT